MQLFLIFPSFPSCVQNAQPIRLLLNYTMTDYVDKNYNFRKVYDVEHPDWNCDKQSLGLDFPNVIDTV